MPRLLVFNPGHEEALSQPAGMRYTPSRTIRTMMHELHPLMRACASSGDLLWVPDRAGQNAQIMDFEGRAISNLKPSEALDLCLWALEPHLILHLSRWAERSGLRLNLPYTSPEYLALSHRRSATRLLEQLIEHFPEGFPLENICPLWLMPGALDFQDSTAILALAEEVSKRSPLREIIVKRPYTSSGRGVTAYKTPLHLNDAQRILRHAQQSGISLEPRLRHFQDYAYLMQVEGKQVVWQGYSKFYTEQSRGINYAGNELVSDSKIRAELVESWGQGEGGWQRLEDFLTSFVLDELQGHYSGYVGIDFFSYFDAAGRLRLHPAVEINVRCTMGVIAHRLREQMLSPRARGSFHVAYIGPKDAVAFDQANRQHNPCIYDKSGRLTQGYLPLTTICTATQFVAYVKVF